MFLNFFDFTWQPFGDLLLFVGTVVLSAVALDVISLFPVADSLRQAGTVVDLSILKAAVGTCDVW